MNRRTVHKTSLLTVLLLLSALTSALGHALQHSDGNAAAQSGPAFEAWCDLCHQPFVAFAPETPAAASVPLVAALPVPVLPEPPPASAPTGESRGPPAAV